MWTGPLHLAGSLHHTRQPAGIRLQLTPHVLEYFDVTLAVGSHLGDCCLLPFDSGQPVIEPHRMFVFDPEEVGEIREPVIGELEILLSDLQGVDGSDRWQRFKPQLEQSSV